MPTGSFIFGNALAPICLTSGHVITSCWICIKQWKKILWLLCKLGTNCIMSWNTHHKMFQLIYSLTVNQVLTLNSLHILIKQKQCSIVTSIKTSLIIQNENTTQNLYAKQKDDSYTLLFNLRCSTLAKGFHNHSSTVLQLEYVQQTSVDVVHSLWWYLDLPKQC